MLERIFYHLYFRHSRWSDVKKKLDSDSRYKNVDSSGLREDYFLDFIHDLKDEHKKKKKDKKRSSRSRSRSPKGKDRSRSRSRRRSKSPKKKSKKDKRDRSRDRDDDEYKKDKKKSKKDKVIQIFLHILFVSQFQIKILTKREINQNRNQCRKTNGSTQK